MAAIRRVARRSALSASLIAGTLLAAVTPAVGVAAVRTGQADGVAAVRTGQADGVSTAVGQRLWVNRYLGPGFAGAAGIAASPSGRTVFVAGATGNQTSAADFAIVAYDGATGAQLWASSYNGPGNGADGAGPIAVSPDGARVFVTGSGQGAGTSLDYATIALTPRPAPGSGSAGTTIRVTAGTNPARWRSARMAAPCS